MSQTQSVSYLFRLIGVRGAVLALITENVTATGTGKSLISED